jgi:hypothetical protein
MQKIIETHRREVSVTASTHSAINNNGEKEAMLFSDWK